MWSGGMRHLEPTCDICEVKIISFTLVASLVLRHLQTHNTQHTNTQTSKHSQVHVDESHIVKHTVNKLHIEILQFTFSRRYFTTSLCSYTTLPQKNTRITRPNINSREVLRRDRREGGGKGRRREGGGLDVPLARLSFSLYSRDDSVACLTVLLLVLIQDDIENGDKGCH